MELVIYTDTDQIRSVLGLSDKDMDDTQLVSRNLAVELKLDLVSWLPTYATLYDAGLAPTATATEQSITDGLTMYCTYFCASLVSMSAPLAAPQSVSDGKNSMSRFSPMAWQDLTTKTSERMAFYKNLLQGLVGSVTGAVSNYAQFATVGLAVDPVTGA